MKVETIGVKFRGKGEEFYKDDDDDSRRWLFYLEIELDAREMDTLFIHSKEGSQEHTDAGDKIVKELDRAWEEHYKIKVALDMYEQGSNDEDEDKNDSENLGESKDR